MTPVVQENTKLKVALIDTPPLVVDGTIKVLSI